MTPGGSDRYLAERGLWNDPGSGRFVRRGWSSDKARAIDLLNASQVELRQALLDAEEASPGEGWVRVRAVDGRLNRSGIPRGTEVVVRVNPDNPDTVIIGGDNERYLGGRARVYRVNVARFEYVGPVEEPDEASVPPPNRHIPSATPVGETPSSEPERFVPPEDRNALWGANLSGRDLSGVDLSGYDLSGANFGAANLSGANLSGANLGAANLSGANLRDADLTGASLTDARLTDANLTNAFLRRADLTNANLTGADLAGVVTDEDTRFPDGFVLPDTPAETVERFVPPEDRNALWGADLSGRDLSGVDLSGYDLRTADLSGAKLNGARLTGAFLTGANLKGANLTGANLTDVILNGANLTDADLADANLTRARLTDANLTRAYLTDAKLPRANLADANLTGARLTDANLTLAVLLRADLTGANLRDADLTGANLTAANLTGANLSGVVTNENTRFPAGFVLPDTPAETVERFVPPEDRTALRGADLSGRDLSGVDLSFWNLSGANLTDANLTGANLSGANLTGAFLTRAYLTDADLSGAYLTGAVLTDADLSGANLSGLNLTDADLTGAYLRGADLRHAVLRRANLSGLNLTGSVLRRADLTNANLNGANLNGANLSNANLRGAFLTAANLTGADLSGVITDEDTRFPAGFVLPDTPAENLPSTAPTEWPTDWGVVDSGAFTAWSEKPSAGRDRLDPSVWALVDGQHVFGVRSGGAIWRQDDRRLTWRPGQPVVATSDSGDNEPVWNIDAGVEQVFPAGDGSFLYQSSSGLQVVRVDGDGEFLVASGDSSGRLLDARPLPDGTWLTLQRDPDGSRSLQIVSVNAEGVQSTPVPIDDRALVLEDTYGVAVVGDTAFLPNWYEDRVTTVNLVDNTVEIESLIDATPVDGQDRPSRWELDDQFNLERGDTNIVGVVLDGTPGVLLPIEASATDRRGYWFVSADGTTSLFAKNNDDGSNPLFDRITGQVVEPTPSASERFVPPEDRTALRGADLSGRDLSGVDLSGYDLSGANLTDANLTGANLSDANLHRAYFRRANLSGADLTGAVLTDANLTGAYLTDANLTGAFLTRANLTDANLTGAYLSGAVLTDTDLRDAVLRRAVLTDAYLSGADMRGADLRRAVLSGADLTDAADLTGADLRGAVLTDANLRGADLTGANLSGVVTDENTRFPAGFDLPSREPTEAPVIPWSAVPAVRVQQARDFLAYQSETVPALVADPENRRLALEARFLADLTASQVVEMADHLNVTENMPPRIGVPSASDSASAVANWLTFGATGTINLDAGDGTVAPDFAAKSVTAHMQTLLATLQTGMFAPPDWTRDRVSVDDEVYARIRALGVRDGENAERASALWQVLGQLTNSELGSMIGRDDWRVWAEANPVDADRVLAAMPSDFDNLTADESRDARGLLTGALVNALMFPTAPDMPSQIDPPPRPSGPDADVIAAITELADLAALRRRVDPTGADRVTVDLSEPRLADTLFVADGVFDNETGTRYRTEIAATTPIGDPANPKALVVTGNTLLVDTDGAPVAGGVTGWRFIVSNDGVVTFADGDSTDVDGTAESMRARLVTVATVLDRARNAGFTESRTASLSGRDAAAAGFDWAPGATDHLRIAETLDAVIREWRDAPSAGTEADQQELNRVQGLVDRLRFYGTVPDRIGNDDFPTPQEVQRTMAAVAAADVNPMVADTFRRLHTETGPSSRFSFTGTMRLVDTPLPPPGPDAILDSPPVVDVSDQTQRAVRRVNTSDVSTLTTGRALTQLLEGDLTVGDATYEMTDIDVRARVRELNLATSSKFLSPDDGRVTVTATVREAATGDVSRRVRLVVSLSAGTVELDFPSVDGTPSEMQGWEPELVNRLVQRGAEAGFNRLRSGDEIDALTMASTGFDWRVGGTSQRQALARQLRDAATADQSLTDEERAEVLALADRAAGSLSGNPAEWGDTPTPFQLLNAGWAAGRPNWLGRQVFADGRPYQGVIRFDPGDFDPEVAARAVITYVADTVADSPRAGATVIPDTTRFATFRGTFQNVYRYRTYRPVLAAAYMELTGEPFVGVTTVDGDERDADGLSLPESLAVAAVRVASPSFVAGPERVSIPQTIRGRRREASPATGLRVDAANPSGVTATINDALAAVLPGTTVSVLRQIDGETLVLRTGFDGGRSADLTIRSNDPVVEVSATDGLLSVAERRALTVGLRAAGFGEIRARGDGYNLALQGYDWDVAREGYDGQGHLRVADRLESRLDELPTEADRAAGRDVIRRLRAVSEIPSDANDLPDVFPTPSEIALLGWEEFAASWVGREVLTDPTVDVAGRQNIQTVARPDPYQPVLRLPRPAGDRPALELTNNAITEAYNVDLGDGYTARARVSGDGPGFSLSGSVYSPSGASIGSFSRSVNAQSRVLGHGSFSMNSSYRGRGIGSRFIAATIDNMAALGIERVSVSAASGGTYNGSYTWARQGFDWGDQYSASQFAPTLRRMADDSTVSSELRAEAMEMADRLEQPWTENAPPADLPTPNDVAVLGWEERTGERWLGRRVMSSHGWNGSMQLSGATARPRPPRRAVRRDQRRAQRTEITENALERLFAITIPNASAPTQPFTTRVVRVLDPRPVDGAPGVESVGFEVQLLDSNGVEQGRFTRSVRSDGIATFDTANIAESIQGQGVGANVLAGQIASLESAGFTAVRTLAVSSPDNNMVGGYVSARAGFDWDSPRDAIGIGEALQAVAEQNDGPPEALEMATLLQAAAWGPDELPPADFPTPNDVAMLGFDRSGNWFGRRFMLGEFATGGRLSWGGVVRLDPPLQRQSAVMDADVLDRVVNQRGAARTVNAPAVVAAVRDGDRLWDTASLRVPRSTAEYAIAQLQMDLDSAPAPNEVVVNEVERSRPRTWWSSDFVASRFTDMFAPGRNLRRREAPFVAAMRRESDALARRVKRLRDAARGTRRNPSFMSQDEAVNEQRALFMEERLRAVLDADPFLAEWMAARPVSFDGVEAPRPLMPLIVPVTDGNGLVQRRTVGSERGTGSGAAEFIGVQVPAATADLASVDVAEYERQIREELYVTLLNFWAASDDDPDPTGAQLRKALLQRLGRTRDVLLWWSDVFGTAPSFARGPVDAPYAGPARITATWRPAIGWLLRELRDNPDFPSTPPPPELVPTLDALRGMLRTLPTPARTASLAVQAALPHDGDGDGLIYDGTKRERPAPVQMPKLDVSSVGLRRRIDEQREPVVYGRHIQMDRERDEERHRRFVAPAMVDRIVKKPTESWSAEDAAYVAKYGTTKRQKRLALTAQARLAREAGNEELARSLEYQAISLGQGRKGGPGVPAAGSPERRERRMVGSAARKLMGRRKGSQPQDVLSNIRKNDRFPELSDRELHEFAAALGPYQLGDVPDARSAMYWELARRAEMQGLSDVQEFYVAQARRRGGGWPSDRPVPDGVFGSGSGGDEWVVSVLPDDVLLLGAAGVVEPVDVQARFNRELAARSRLAGNEVLADGFERAAAGLEGGQSIDALQQDGGVSGDGLVERIRVEEGFTLDPRAGVFPESGFSVGVPGFSAIITREEFEKPGVAERFIADYLKKMRDDGVDDLHIGGWWDKDNDEIVLDRVEVLDDRDEAIAAGRERNEQAIFDLATKTVIPTGGTGGREDIDIIGAEARSVPSEEAVQPDDGRGDRSGGGPVGEPDAAADRGTAGRPTTDEVNAAWETWSRNPADEEAARVLADGLFAHDLGDGITTEVDKVSSSGNNTSVYGTIMSDGTMIGNFERVLTTVYVDSDGQPVDEEEIDGDMDVVNVELNVFDRFQGRGIGMRFFAAQVQEAARDHRFDRMTTLAMSTSRGMNGAYVWAKAGYDFDGPATDALRDPDGNPDGGEYFLSLLEDADPDLWQRIMDDPYDITPADLAASPAAAEILKNEDVSWTGVYDLTAVTPEPVDGGFPVSEEAVGRLSTEQIEALLAKGDVPANVQAWLSAELEGRTAVVAASSGGGKYTKPELRDRLKAKIMAGSKGGDPGEWSARKAQLLAQEYEAAGGGYRGGKSETQRSLSEWTKEEWTTSDGKPSEGKRRYLPKEAWEKLTPAQKRATNAKKAKGTKAGKQFVGNTEVAKRAARLVRKRDK